MKNIIRKKIKKSERKINRRLKNAAPKSGKKPTLDKQNIHYEIADKVKGIVCGGIGLIHGLVLEIGFIGKLNAKLKILKQPVGRANSLPVFGWHE